MIDPIITQRRIEMKLASGELVRRVSDGRLVCTTCGGNCGQCGDTDILGNVVPADMNTLIRSMVAGRPALKPRVVEPARSLVSRLARRIGFAKR